MARPNTVLVVHVHAMHDATNVGVPASMQGEPGEGAPDSQPMRVASLPATSARIQCQQRAVALHVWRAAGSVQDGRQRWRS